VAVNREGRAEASMGIAAADYDSDGDEDLFVTHLTGESNTLYVNLGGGLFEDRTAEAGLAVPSLPFTSFGTGWIDADADGSLDLVVLNGAVRILEEQAAAGHRHPLKQRNQLFLQRVGRFHDASERAGDVFAELAVSRGAAFGDVDNDGALDILQLDNHAAARLLRGLRVEPSGSAWLGLAAAPAAGALAGTTLRMRGAAGLVFRRSHTDGSYASASDPRILATLAAAPAPSQASAPGWLHVEAPGMRPCRWPLPTRPVYLVMPSGSLWREVP
jgi:hypothetical protein